MILEKRHRNHCANKRCQHVHPDALGTHIWQDESVIVSYLVHCLSETECRVQASTGSKREIVAHAEDIGQSQAFQEEVCSLGILIFALGESQIEQCEETSLQNFLPENSAILESNITGIFCVLIQTVHITLGIQLVAGDIVLGKQICEEQSKQRSNGLEEDCQN